MSFLKRIGGAFRAEAGTTTTLTGDATADLIGYLAGKYGGAADRPDELAVYEAAAGLLGRSFATATVEGDAMGIVKADALETLGRELLRRGNAIFSIEDDRLKPASDWDIRGGDDPRRWAYRLTFAGPVSTRSAVLPASRVAHFRVNCLPSSPHHGRSPFTIALATARTAWKAERAASGELEVPSTRIVPIGGTSKQLGEIAEEIGKGPKAGKRITIVGTPQDGLGGVQPRQWHGIEIKPDPTTGFNGLRSGAALDLLAAAGIPPGLIVATTDGTAQRESYRRFLHTVVLPWGKIVEGELSMKMGGDVRLSFDGLMASDLSGRARAFQSMVNGGMDVSRAAALAGLMADDS